MKMRIDVDSRKEGELISSGLGNANVRALAIITGALAELPTIEARHRVLAQVSTMLQDDGELVLDRAAQA